MFELNPYLTALFAIFAAIFIYFRRHFTYWHRRGVSGPSFMELKQFVVNHHDYTLEATKKYGRVYGSFDLTRKLVIVNEPDLLRDIYVKDFHNFTDRKHIWFGESKFKKGLFFLREREDWKRVRSILSPTFSSGKLRAMMSHMSDISDQFVDNLVDFEKRGEVVDMRKYIGAFAMDVISACAYGIRVDSLNNPNHPIVVNAKRILGVDGSLSQVVSVLAPGLAELLKLEFFNSDATTYFDNLTNQILKERKQSNKYPNSKKKTDFVQLMLDSERHEDLGYDSNSDVEITPMPDERNAKPKGTLTPDEMTAQGVLFFIAGYDTTSAAISHTIYFMAQNKEYQQNLYEELQTVEDMSYENVNHLKYLNAVVSETLRLAPSLTRIQRECVSDYKLGNTGITIPSGASVEIFPYALHRDPEFWPEPEEFKPERFLNPTHHPYAYIPFGGGPRLCIGQRFALNEMRMCIAKLFNRYEFSLAPGFQIEYFTGNVLMNPKQVLCHLKAR